MSTYTTKTKVSESKQQFIEESNKQKRQTLLTIILIFFLILLLLFSVLISNKFTITSMDVRKSNKQVEFAYYEIGKTETQQPTTSVVEKPKETEPTKSTTTNIPQTQKTQTTTTTQSTTSTEPKITSSEKRVGIDGKIITSKNIKTYHSRLLKEFEGKEIETYKIVWGDTLWKIALKFNTSAHTLYVLNALDNPDLIIAGKYLKVVKNFVLPKERTEKILEEALKGNTGLNINNNTKICHIFAFDCLIFEKNQNIIQKVENI